MLSQTIYNFDKHRNNIVWMELVTEKTSSDNYAAALDRRRPKPPALATGHCSNSICPDIVLSRYCHGWGIGKQKIILPRCAMFARSRRERANAN